jgi:hypothetical protein
VSVKGVAHHFVLAGKVAQMAIRCLKFNKVETVKVLDNFQLQFNWEVFKIFGRHCEARSALAGMSTPILTALGYLLWLVVN